MRGFQKSNFSKFHPGGNLGKDLVIVRDIMHEKSKLPLVNSDDSMAKTLITMTKKSFGCVGVINKSKNLSDTKARTTQGDVFIGGLKVKAISGADSTKLKIKTRKFN